MATSLGAPERALDSDAASPVAPAGNLPAAPAPVTRPPSRLHALTMSIFLGLEAIAVALGLIVYAADPFGFVHPQLALVSVVAMAATAVAARVLPALHRRASRVRSLEVAALLLYAVLMSASMGAANSPFIALYALALLASALLWDPWPVVVLAILTFGFTFLQTDYSDLMDGMPLFAAAVVLLNALLPAAVAAAVISMVRKLSAAIGVANAEEAHRSVNSEAER